MTSTPSMQLPRKCVSQKGFMLFGGLEEAWLENKEWVAAGIGSLGAGKL